MEVWNTFIQLKKKNWKFGTFFFFSLEKRKIQNWKFVRDAFSRINATCINKKRGWGGEQKQITSILFNKKKKKKKKLKFWFPVFNNYLTGYMSM